MTDKNFTKKIIALAAIFLSFSTSTALAISKVELMHDALARAYYACSNADRKASKTYFKKAFNYAKRANDWSGIIDAGMGMLVLGRQEDANTYFNYASSAIKKQKDWRGEIALAYVNLSMPLGLVDKHKTVKSFTRAAEYAAEKSDWRGVMEAAKGFKAIDSKDKFSEYSDLANRIVGEAKNSNGLGKYYEEYARYYGYFYYTRYYDGFTYATLLPSDWLSQWGNHNLEVYEERDSYYFYIGR